MNITANRIRFPLDITKALDIQALVDPFSSLTPLMPRARASQFEIALFNNDSLDTLAQFTSLTLEVKALNASGYINPAAAVTLSKTIAAVDFNTLLTRAEWDNDSGNTPWHVLFEFSEAEMTAIPAIAETDNRHNYGIVITGMTASGRVTLGSGIITAVDDGGTGAGAAVQPTVSYSFSDQEIQAGLATKVNLGENEPGAQIILRDASTGLGIIIRAIVDPGASSARLDVVQIP